MSLASARLVANIDILTSISSYCHWKTLVSLIHTGFVFRPPVFTVIRIRIKHIIGHFIPELFIELFFHILSCTDSVVAGPVVRCAISFDQKHIYNNNGAPNQLDIITPTPHDARDPLLHHHSWQRFLKTCGYSELMNTEDVPVHLSPCAIRWAVFKSDRGDGRTISLLQSVDGSALAPILKANNTSNYYLLTPTRIYCMYPHLFACKSNIVMRGLYSDRPCAFSTFNYGLRSSEDTSSWDQNRGYNLPCMNACPVSRRTVYGLKGIGVVRWGGIHGSLDIGGNKSLDDLFHRSWYSWKMDGTCHNPYCGNITRPSALIDEI